MANKYELFFDNKAPETSGRYQVQKFDTSGSAASAAWATGLSTDVPKGPVWIELTALTTAAWVRFGSSATTGTTAANGAYLPLGTPKKFFVDPTRHAYIDVLATGAGTMLAQVVSQDCGRNYI